MKSFTKVFIALLVCLPLAQQAKAVEVFDIDLAGFETFGEFDNVLNTQVTVDLFANASILAIEWVDLEFTTENGSWQSELVLSVNDSANTGAAATFWDFAPAQGLDSSGTFSGSGSFDAVNSEFGSGPFQLLADGQATIYVYELFDDPGGTGSTIRDALITQGTLRITAIPEPSSLAVLGCLSGGLICRRRRRS